MKREDGAYERSELQADRDEVFDDRQVLGDGPEGGRVRVGSAAEGPETEVEPRTAGGEKEVIIWYCRKVGDGMQIFVSAAPRGDKRNRMLALLTFHPLDTTPRGAAET